MICALIVHVLGAESVGDDQNLEGIQRRLYECFTSSDDLITIVDDQISKGLVTASCRVKIVMGFIEQHPRITLVKGRTLNVRLELRVSNLLGRNRRRSKQNQS